MADTHNRGSTAKRDASKKQPSRRKKQAVAAATAGAAIGIGSAALVAALLYANRDKENRPEPITDRRFEPQDS